MYLSKSVSVYKDKQSILMIYMSYLCNAWENYCTTHGIKVQDIEAVVLADISDLKLILLTNKKNFNFILDKEVKI